MKVFTLSNVDKDKYLKNDNDIEDRNLKFSWNEPANCITIANHKNSGNIYIIYGIKLNLYGKIDSVDVFMGKDDCRICSNRESIFNLDYILKEDMDEFLQIGNILADEDESFDILKSDVDIVLPGGCLIIKLNENVSSLEIDMKFQKYFIG
ncbi:MULTISPECIES: hypothetical protein [Clostridium]|uniref:hypothetical protein n=1 Tax=Clostridium TaxID=1485 RepID=UPI000825B15C|nr:MULTISPECIES: hypothetical protein [Clostridium]PJI08751.1 hypothetical protein CUB90_13125 [Clostridium sp. CT7]